MQGQRIRKPLGLRDWQAAQQRARDMEATGIEKVGEAVTVRKAFQLPTSLAPRAKPNSMSVKRDRPLQMTAFPGAASLARAR